MGSYDIFLNSTKDSFLKHDSMDILEQGNWNIDNDKFLESIRYGDILLEDDILNVSKTSPLEDKLNVEEEVEVEIDQMCETIEVDSSELVTFTSGGDEILSVDSASSAGSCSSEVIDEQPNFSVVELVGILPPDVKTFKIVQQVPRMDDMKILNVRKVVTPRKSKATTTTPTQTAAQELKLTDEERRLLVKEGISLPTHYPLTKSEERELKRIRRKIRNKISAQDSRKRKKEFLDTLQQRVQEVEEEKTLLSKKVNTLELVNARLSAQVKKLQTALNHIVRSSNSAIPGNPAAITRPNGNVVPAATTLLVLILSIALVVLPTMQKAAKSSSQNHTPLGLFDESNTSLSGKSRTMMDIASRRNEVFDDSWEDVELEPEPVAKMRRLSFPAKRPQGLMKTLTRESLSFPSSKFANIPPRKEAFQRGLEILD